MTTRSEIEAQALSWFIQQNDADAPESVWLAFIEWLEADPAHAAAYDAVERLWIDLDEVGSAGPMVVASRVANDDAPLRGRPRRRPAWLYPGLAAAAAVLVMVGAWPTISGRLSTQTYHTDEAPRTVTLADGSRIDLNRHSDLTVRLASAQRDVVLSDGEAAFDVAHDASRPFVIRSGEREVRVLGTAFNVLSHQGRFSVGVRRGVVAVDPAGPAGPVRLVAGQKIDQANAGAAVVSQMDPTRVSAWRDGVLIYRNSTLADVADDLSRYLDKPVTVSASAQSLRFTGVLQVADEARMLEQLQGFLPIDVDRSSTGVRLTRRDAR